MNKDTRKIETWDAVVVGGGVMGSFAAYHLAKQGVKTVLLEQVATLTKSPDV